MHLSSQVIGFRLKAVFEPNAARGLPVPDHGEALPQSRVHSRGKPSHMLATLWYIVVGLLLVAMALSGLGAQAAAAVDLDALPGGRASGSGPAGSGCSGSTRCETRRCWSGSTEVAVIVSLFTAGLKLRVPLRDGRWRTAGAAGLRLDGAHRRPGRARRRRRARPAAGAPRSCWARSWRRPTRCSPPTCRSTDPTDRDRLRFGLTGEAGLNDGTAFPFVMLGLGLLGLHELGDGGWRWLAVDVVWAVAARPGDRRAARRRSSAGWSSTCGARTGRRWAWTTSWRWG